MKDDLKLLNNLMYDYKAMKRSFQSKYWGKAENSITKEIRKHGVKNFRSMPTISKGFEDILIKYPFEGKRSLSLHILIDRLLKSIPLVSSTLKHYHNTIDKLIDELQYYRSVEYSRDYGEWFYKNFKKIDNLNTLIGNPNNNFVINKKKISSLYFKSLLYLDNISNFTDPKKISSFCEIGGGFGALTHCIHHLYPNVRKILFVEVPSVAYLATCYLKEIYGNNIIDYNITRKLKSFKFSDNNDLEICVIPPWELDKISSKIEMFYSSNAFQIMEWEMIYKYVNSINKLKKNGNSMLVIKTLKKEEYQESFINSDILIERLHKIFDIKFTQFQPKLSFNDEEFHYSYI